MLPFFKKTKEFDKLGYIVAVFFIVFFVIVALPFFLQQLWSGKVYPNVKLAGIVVGGAREEEIKEQLVRYKNSLEEEGIKFSLGADTVTVYTLVTAPTDPDLTYELVFIDANKTIDNIMQVGRNGNLFTRWLSTYSALFLPKSVPVEYQINETAVQETLHNNFGSREEFPRNASFSYESGEIEIIVDKPGTILNYAEALTLLDERLSNLSLDVIKLSLIDQQPRIKYAEAISLKNEAQDILDAAPYTIIATTTDAGIWQESMQASSIATWLEPTTTDEGVTLAFGEGLKKYLNLIASDLNQSPQDARFEIVDGRIDQFQASRDGREIDIEATKKHFSRKFITEGDTEASIIFKRTSPKVTTEQVNNIGIKEKIGTGKSDFTGSPYNRRVNIKVASDKLNGLLIPPNEEFSLVEALKPFTVEAGYLPELVIKGNRLIPEVGGGACQIGTTTFRAALDAGLDITQRRNHSFAVSYYNDENGLPGTDATIYDPAPDFRFVNNTAHYILIQTHIGEDDILTYEFWGTNDGRKASTTKPVILARQPAPDTKYIETEDLEPGVTECSGSNVPGYTTTFTYSVLAADGEYQEESFDSKYRPWQRVCLIGVETVSQETAQADESVAQ